MLLDEKLREITRLREKVDRLEFENRELRAVVAPDAKLLGGLRLTAKETQVLQCIARRGPVGTAYLVNVIYVLHPDPPEFAYQGVGVMIFRLRQKLAVRGVNLNSRSHHGYWLEPEDLAKLKALEAI